MNFLLQELSHIKNFIEEELKHIVVFVLSCALFLFKIPLFIKNNFGKKTVFIISMILSLVILYWLFDLVVGIT